MRACVQTYQGLAPRMGLAWTYPSCTRAASSSNREHTETKPWLLNLLPCAELGPTRWIVRVLSLDACLGRR